MPGAASLARWLPSPVIRWVKRWHYPRALKKFDPARWPGSSVVERLIRPGDCVVDAGSNIGYVAMLLARWVGPTGRVYGFEPMPETFSYFERNMRVLGLAQVTPHCLALSDHEGDGVMSAPVYEGGGGTNFYEARLLHGGSAGTSVQVATLDRALSGENRRIRFIKIDVEGHEADLLRGAANRLTSDRPALFIEMSGMPDEPGPGQEVDRQLTRLGYRSYLESGGRLLPWVPGRRAADLFYLADDQRSALGE